MDKEESAIDSAMEKKATSVDIKVPLVVAVAVKFPKLSCFVITAFMLLFTGLALPFFAFGDPLTGLRLRDDIAAIRSDAWIQGLQELRPDTKENNNQRTTERVQKVGTMTIYYLAEESGDNVYTLENIKKMADLEDKIIQTPEFEKYCLIDLDNGGCTPPFSPVKYLRNATNQAEIEIGLQNMWADRDANKDPTLYHFDLDFNNETNLKGKLTRSDVYFGLPLAGYLNTDDRLDEQKEIRLDWFLNSAEGEDKSTGVFEIMNAARRKGFEEDPENEMKVTYFQSDMFNAEVLMILVGDVTFAGGSILCVLFFLGIHTGSPFLAIMGLFQILMSFPVCFFIYRIILDIELFGGLNVISIYLLLGIGVDDIFLYTDALYQSKSLLSGPGWTFEKRLGWAFRRASYSMLTTSVTTGFSFLMLALAEIPIVRYFGVFTALLIVTNFALVCTFFTCILVLWDKYFAHGCSRGDAKAAGGILDVQDEVDLEVKTLSKSENENGDKFRMTERFFKYRVTPLILKKRVRYVLFAVFFIFFVVSIAFASLLEPDGSLIFWPEGHYFEIAITANEDFKEPRVVLAAEGANQVVWGMQDPPIDRSKTDETVAADFGEPKYLSPSEFNLADPAAQQYMADSCIEILEKYEAKLKLKQITLSGRDEQAKCFMVAFKLWREARNQTFPIPLQTAGTGKVNVSGIPIPAYAVQETFEDELLEFFNRPQFAIEFFIQVSLSRNGGANGELIRARGAVHEFFTTNIESDSYDYRVERKEAWDDLLETINNEQPASLGTNTFYTDDFYWVLTATQYLITLNAFVSLGLAFVIAFFFTTLATGNVVVGGLAMVPLMGVVGCVLGFIRMNGWALGAIESVNVVLVVGISVDYIVHLGVAYAEGGLEQGLKTRDERTEHALVTLGTSVLFGGFSTFFAASFLLFTTIIFFSKFATIMAVTVATALLWALLVFPSLLATFGPEHEYGNVCSRFHQQKQIQSSNDVKVRTREEAVCFGKAVLIFLAIFVAISATIFAIEYQSLQEDEVEFEGFSDEQYLPAWSELKEFQWEEMRPAGDTVCARGTPYAFFVRKGAPGSPVIYEFEGGGACWSLNTCQTATETFKDTVEDTRSSFQRKINGQERPEGIQDENGPYAEFTHVFIPYCTGDLHWGNNTQQYTDSLTIRHKGAVNAGAAMQWAFENVPTPERVLVTGCSAGSYGSLLWGANIALHYENVAGNGTKVIQVGDGGMGIISDDFLTESFPSWKAELTEFFPYYIFPDNNTSPSNLDISSLSLPLLYNLTANRFPTQTWGQLSSAYDWNQAFFFLTQQVDEGRIIESQDKIDWNVAMRQVYDPFFQTLPDNLYYFLGPGDYHCSVPYNRHYYVENGDGNPFFETMYRMLVDDVFPAQNLVDCLDISSEYCREGVDLRNDIKLLPY